MLPSVLKHLDTFSVRELMDILSAFRKLEFTKLDCIDLLLNQLVLKAPEWNAVDVSLLANSLSWFRIFDENVWKKIEKFVLKNSRDFSPLGISLVVAALAKLDMRNERILACVAGLLIDGSFGGVMKQESFALLIHGFYKLSWDRNIELNLFVENQLNELLDSEYFDLQSLSMVMHALFCYRLVNEPTLSDIQTRILTKGFESVQKNLQEKSLSFDQEKRFDEICFISQRWSGVDKQCRAIMRTLRTRFKERNTGHKLPRWEYEVYRILRDKMGVSVGKKHRNGKTNIVIKSAATNEDVPVLCLGPFQYYANSTKRTASSLLARELAGGSTVLEIPYFVWNELKTDQDKIAYLFSQGRRALSPSS
jgi:hypothetical protein